MTRSQHQPPRIYSYVRFSSQRQLKGDSLRRQNELIDRYVKQKGYVLDQEFRYVDIQPAFRGKNLKEGNLGLFIEAIKLGRVPVGSVLLVESLDRLTRLQPTEAVKLFLEIVNAGVIIVTLADEAEHRKDIPSEQQFLNLLMSVTVLCRAHEESLTKSKRLKKAWEEKRKNIKTKFYSSRIPSWLRVNEKTEKVEAVKAKAATVRRMFTLCLKGNHAEGIAKIFRKEKRALVGGGKNWTHSYVSQTLRNSTVTGDFTPHRMDNGKRVPAGETVANYYPAIVTKSEFNRVQFIMDSRSKHKRGGRVAPLSDHLFSKLLHCGYCGARVYRTAKGRYYKGVLRRTLLCRNAKDGTGCFYVGWEYDEFEKSFLQSAGELTAALKGQYGNGPLRKKIASLSGRHSEIQKKLNNLIQLGEMGESDKSRSQVLLTRIVTLEKEREAVAKMLAESEKELVVRLDGPVPLVELEKLLKKMQNESVRKIIADLVSQLFDRIDLFPAGSKYQFAKLKHMHAQLVKKFGKADGHVSAHIRENFDRRKVRFFQPVLNLPGIKKRMTYSDRGNLMPEVRLDLVDDLPDNAAIALAK